MVSYKDYHEKNKKNNKGTNLDKYYCFYNGSAFFLYSDQ